MIKVLFFFLFWSQIALGEEIYLVPDCQDIHEVFMTWPWLGKVGAAVIASMGTLRGVAELLLRFAPASKYGKIAHVIATAIGAFGIGTPKGPKCKEEKAS